MLNGVSYVGRNAAGTATVSGNGSNWQTQDLNIGYDANAIVSILNGGTISTKMPQ